MLAHMVWGDVAVQVHSPGQVIVVGMLTYSNHLNCICVDCMVYGGYFLARFLAREAVALIGAVA